jgi:hypothetical protein
MWPAQPYGRAARCRLALRNADGAPAQARTTVSQCWRLGGAGEGDMAVASLAKGSEETQISHRSSCFGELRDRSFGAANSEDGCRAWQRRLGGD